MPIIYKIVASLMLIGFLGDFIYSIYLSERKPINYNRLGIKRFDEYVLKIKTNLKIIREIQLINLLGLIIICIQIGLVFYGMYLIKNGYSIEMVDSSKLFSPNIIAKGRGLVLLLISIIFLFPYYLIFGYGYLAIRNIKIFRKMRRYIRHNKVIGKKLISRKEDDLENFFNTKNNIKKK